MKFFFLFAFFFLASVAVSAQDIYLTRNGKITFFSHTSVEDIDAVNNEVFSTINIKNGNLQFLVLIKGFQFKKAAMQQHFNDKEYLNSTEFPKSEFKGSVVDLSKVNFTKDGTYPVQVEGNLTLHGVTNKIKSDGSIIINGGKINSSAKFLIKLSDYKITVPSIVTAKVAETVEVTVNCTYQPYK
jgi:polyisoprenoid-binding protein YceI